MNKLVLPLIGVSLTMLGANLQVNDVVHGFQVKSITDLPDVQGRLVRMEYVRTGTDLAWLDRADENKTFAIGFRTFPVDDTGVAHIIEHSVLCGSEKYPVKEPFVDLLKSSFATFLNAWTSADSTMYPVCSRNNKDFSNLVDVYMDAVLHPLSMKSPLAFKQEGWHYELEEDGELKRNGVVYSEMKGAYSNPDRLLYATMERLLYPETGYRFESGGDPTTNGVPQLTYEKYQAFYRRYYHPSNARIFLDGHVELNTILTILDSYLKDYTRQTLDVAVPFQKPVTASRTISYELSPEEDPLGKVILADGWVFGRWDEREKLTALDVISDALTDSNEAPLKKALLSQGLCEDVRLGVGSQAQLEAQLIIKHVKAENVDRVRQVVRETLTSLVQKGLDQTRLGALLNRAEFHTREKFGLDYFCEAYDQWLYGGDPAHAFRPGKHFASLRAKLKTGWFERVLEEALLKNPHHAQLTMIPSTTLAAENAAAEKAELAQIKASWSEAQLKQVRAEMKELKTHQESVDKPEDIAKLPVLKVSDIPERGPEQKVAQEEVNGVRIVRPHTTANGIAHVQLYFSLADLTDEELKDLPTFTNVLGDLPTAHFAVQQLKNKIDSSLGRFSTSLDVFTPRANPFEPVPYLTVSVSVLDDKKDEIFTLLPEVLRNTSFSDSAAVGKIVRQQRIHFEKAVSGLGARLFADMRATSQMTPHGAVCERLAGLEQLRHIQNLDASYSQTGSNFCARLADFAQRLFVRERLTICASDNVPLAWSGKLVKIFPAGTMGAPQARCAFPRQNEGWTTTGGIASACKVAQGTPNQYSGTAVVATRILSLNYLWDEIRVKGGAYGGGLSMSTLGKVRWLSWNDPKPSRTLGIYDQCGAALRQFATGEDALDRYIIGSVSMTEPLQTPYEQTVSLGDLIMNGRTPENIQKIRREILNTTKKDLALLAVELDTRVKDAAICVVGGAKAVESCTNVLQKIQSVTQANRTP